MYKGLVAYSIIPVVVFLAFFTAFKTTYTLDEEMYSIEGLELAYNSPSKAPKIETPKKIDYYLPTLGKCFVGFKEALAFKESRGNYFSVNTFGYMGKYQFGKNTLKLIGIYNTNNFLNTPELQEKAFIANAMRNKWILRRDIKRFVGKTIDGIKPIKNIVPYVNEDKTQIIGSIIYVDNYGNVVTNIKRSFFEQVQKGRTFEISARNYKFKKIFNKYSEIVNFEIPEDKRQDEGRKLVVFNSSGFLEIAVFKSNPSTVGSASTLLGLGIMDTVSVSFSATTLLAKDKDGLLIKKEI